MAQELTLSRTGEVVKSRPPLNVIGLTLVTLGLYGIYWYYAINKELAAVGKAHGSEAAGTSPGKSLLAVTLGALLIVPAIMSRFGTGKRLEAARGMEGITDGMSTGGGFALSLLLGPVGTWFLQKDLNRVLAAGSN